MADIRWLLKPDSGGLNWKTVLMVLALLTVLGAVPVLIIGVGPVVISTMFVAMAVLIARKYKVL